MCSMHYVDGVDGEQRYMLLGELCSHFRDRFMYFLELIWTANSLTHAVNNLDILVAYNEIIKQGAEKHINPGIKAIKAHNKNSTSVTQKLINTKN